MKANIYLRIFLAVAMTVVFVTAASAQDDKPVEGEPGEPGRRADNRPHRGNALRHLGLSPDQIQQIRRLNIERKPLMDEAQKRFREANRSLDEAIYADQVNETDVQTRLREVQLAQGEVARSRFTNELAVRRILTPEQLIRFRELRQRFEQARQNFERRRPPNGERRRPQDGSSPIKRVIRQNQPKPDF